MSVKAEKPSDIIALYRDKTGKAFWEVYTGDLSKAYEKASDHAKRGTQLAGIFEVGTKPFYVLPSPNETQIIKNLEPAVNSSTLEVDELEVENGFGEKLGKINYRTGKFTPHPKHPNRV